jgi:hypothetical protein
MCSTAVFGLFILTAAIAAAGAPPTPIDTFPDTWTATDGLGRTLPGHQQVGPPRPDKYVGIFYFLWLGQHGTDGPYDITKILATQPQAMTQPSNPAWGALGRAHHWGEPLFGYYLSDDPWVLRKHAQMLSDAGVDVVIFDVTNQHTYPKAYTRLCEVFTQVRCDGGRTPQIAFLCPFWDPPRVADQLYANLYKPGLYSELWFRWQGKPLILADPDKVNPNLRGFFTFRKPQPDYFQGPTGPDQWGWLEIYPQHVFRNAAGQPEQMTVGVAQNAQGKRLCAFSEKDTYGRSWHDGAKDPRPDAVNLGLNFAEQFEHALRQDPQFIFITGWNEWFAGRFAEFGDRREPVMFVDEFTQEYSRDIEPMKGGHFDNYYYQMVAFIRRFKGVRKPPAPSLAHTITVDGKFDDWQTVQPEYRDDLGDTMHRDHPGYDRAGRYLNTTGRNDFTLLKAAVDDSSIYFYGRTAEPVTPPEGNDWMLLFVDADLNPATGWNGYDFLANRRIENTNSSSLESLSADGRSAPVGDITLRVSGRELELSIPRSALGFKAATTPAFDFKWADNVQFQNNVAAFILNGDTAPNNRFNYRY